MGRPQLCSPQSLLPFRTVSELEPVSSFEENLRSELHAALMADESRVGDVYRCRQEGLNSGQIQETLGLATHATVGHALRSIRAICEGWNPPGIGPANRAKSDLGRLLRDSNFSGPVREVLKKRYEELEENVQRISDRVIVDADTESSLGKSSEVDSDVPGVYVWTIPTYLETEDERGQIWFRVGCSENVMERMRQHRSNVKLPEPLLLARVYSHPQKSPKELEDMFHQICQSAVHTRALVNNREREWFRTNLDFLDRYAIDIGCVQHQRFVDEDL